MGAKRSSEDPPQVSTRPSVQELQGALSLGNGKIIKQVTSGTCFSEATSGRDNSVSVSDGRGFPGLATGLCWVWLIGGCWDKLCLLISPTRSSLCLYPELPLPAPSQQVLQASAGAGVGTGWPWGPPAPGLRQGWARCELGCESSVPELCAWDESYEKKLEWKGWEFFTGVSLLSKHPKAAISSEVEFLSQVLPQHEHPEELNPAVVCRFPRAMQDTHTWLRSAFLALHWV